MKRLALALAAGLGSLLAQSGIAPPLAGYIRDKAGDLRPVHGITGNLLVGRPVASGVIEAYFSGRFGVARTATGYYLFGADGQLLGPLESVVQKPLPETLSVEAEGLVFRKTDGTELRSRMTGAVLGIEQMSEGWFHVRQEGRSLAVRVREDRLEVFQLPGSPQP